MLVTSGNGLPWRKHNRSRIRPIASKNPTFSTGQKKGLCASSESPIISPLSLSGEFIHEYRHWFLHFSPPWSRQTRVPVEREAKVEWISAQKLRLHLGGLQQETLAEYWYRGSDPTWILQRWLRHCEHESNGIFGWSSLPTWTLGLIETKSWKQPLSQENC